MTSYQMAKENARNQAVEWERDFANHDYSYEELIHWQEYFEKIGRRYGLLAEFRENGIC